MRALLRVWSPSGDVLVTDGGAITVQDRDTGDALRFGPGLNVGDDVFAESMSWQSGGLAPRSAVVGVIGGGGLAVEGTAELSLLLDDGDDYADRSRVASGRLQGLEAEEQWWQATIVDDTADDRGSLLDPDAIVSDATWPRTSGQRAADGAAAYVSGSIGREDRIEGAPYPVPIGLPGADLPLTTVGISVVASLPGGPGLLVEENAGASFPSDRAILIGPWPLEASHVQISGDRNTSAKAPWAERVAVELAHDRQGRPVAVCYPTTMATTPDQGSEVWVSYTAADGGGILDPYGPGRLERADHVIRWALERSDLRVARRELPRLGALAGVSLGFTVSSDVRPWDWIQSEILGVLPLSVAQGPDGVYLWPWLPSLTQVDAVATYRVGENARRPGSWRAADLSPVSRLSIAYAADARSGQHGRRWTLADKRRTRDPAGLVGADYWAARARAGLAQDIAEEMQAGVIRNVAGAQLAASWAIQARCRPQLLVELWVPRAPRDLLPGDVVRVIDSSMGIDMVAQAEAVRYAGDNQAIVSLRAWAPPGPEIGS